MKGIEPSSQPWQGRIITIILHLHINWWERCDSNTRSPKAVDLQSTAIAAMRLSHIKPTSSVITKSVSLFYSRGSEDYLLVSSHLVLAGTSSESRTHKQLLLRQAALPICVSKHINWFLGTELNNHLRGHNPPS